MKPILEAYLVKQDPEDIRCNEYSYQKLIDAMDVTTIINTDLGSYSGDSLYLVKEGNRFGYLQFGWGSCSGCDALQACRNYKELDELRQSLYDSIKWFDSAKEGFRWFLNHDWKGDYLGSNEDVQIFVDKCAAYLVREMLEV